MSHYYELTNAGVVEPRHFVPVASRSGELRATTIRDAKKFGWVPSVTTVAGLLDKPALTNWKIDEHLKQAFYLIPWADDELPDIELFVEKVKAETQSALDKAPKDGTDFHDVLAKWFDGEQEGIDEKAKGICRNVDGAIRDKAGSCLWLAETSFIHPLGFAGKVDLRTNDNGAWVLDHKTKNTADKWKPGKMAYSEMAMQLAAYRVGLGLDNARCANVFICLENGEVEFHEWEEEELSKQWANFSDLLRIWIRNAGYVPGGNSEHRS